MQSGNDGGSDQQQQTQKTQPAVPTTTTGAAAGMGVGVGLGQQQWVAMQYPAAAMLMQHQMMAPSPANYQVTPHYMPYHPHHLHHQPHTPVVQPPQQGSGGGDNKAIWVGDLHSWMDEDYLRNCFASTGEVLFIISILIYIAYQSNK